MMKEEFATRKKLVEKQYEWEKKAAGDNHDLLQAAETKHADAVTDLKIQELEAERKVAKAKI